MRASVVFFFNYLSKSGFYESLTGFYQLLLIKFCEIEIFPINIPGKSYLMPKNSFPQSTHGFSLRNRKWLSLAKTNTVQRIHVLPQFKTHTKFGKLWYPWKGKKFILQPIVLNVFLK